ncbi:MAG: tetratricopeptide repeat protein [Vulcanimicrobiota bacterium]
MNLEEHLNRFTSEGTYDSQGSFTLDRKKALEKLGNFSLESWTDVLFLLGAWLQADGDDPVSFELTRQRLTIRRTSTHLTPEYLKHLEDYLLVSRADHGISQLALARHGWPPEGTFAVGCEGIKRKWESGKERLEDWGAQQGVEIELTHPSMKDPGEVAEFLASHLAWTSFPWIFNGLSLHSPPPSTRSLMTLNDPSLPQHATPGVALHRPDFDFQLYCHWHIEDRSVVVVEGVAYLLEEPPLAGLRTVVFCNRTPLNITRTEAAVSPARRERWREGVLELVKAFLEKPHFWNNQQFLKQFGRVLGRAIWGSLEHPACLAAAQHLVEANPKAAYTPMLLARAAMRRGDHLAALYHLRPLISKRLTPEEQSYAEDVDAEFASSYPRLVLNQEEFRELQGEYSLCVELGAAFPRAIQAFCLNLAAAAEALGLWPQAENLYLCSYFLPRGLKPERLSTFLQVHSYLDTVRHLTPDWVTHMDFKENYLQGIWSVIDLAQRCQSSQTTALVKIVEKLRWGSKPKLLPELNRRRLEGWRLERRASQAEWFKWHLVAKLQRFPPRYPPLSHDESYQIPNFFIGDGFQARLALLRCRTVYLEYAALSYRLAEAHQQFDQLVRFEAILKKTQEWYQSYEEVDHPQEIAELARVAQELGRTEEAAEMLKRAVCKYPVGDFERLPLLVDMAILEPHRAESVLRGLYQVLKIHRSPVGSLERMTLECLWPFPLALPERLKRLAWELSPPQALEVYRLASVLYRKALGSPRNELTDQDWVAGAISLLSRL